MTRRILYGSAVSLAIVAILSGCAAPNAAAPGPGVTAPPPPPPQQKQDQLFAPVPGDNVQSPGGFVPSPGSGVYRGN
jgi:hypothetical protein